MPRGGARPNSGPKPKPKIQNMVTDAMQAVLEAARLEGINQGRLTQEAAAQTQQPGAMPVAATSPRQTLLLIMRFWMGIAASEQQKGAAANMTVMVSALEQARHAAAQAAPYYHARLAALSLSMGGHTPGQQAAPKGGDAGPPIIDQGPTLPVLRFEPHEANY